MLLALLIGFNHGAVLELSGPESRIEMGGAALEVACMDRNASFADVEVTGDTAAGGTVTLGLLNVHPTCAGLSITTPCASHPNEVPRRRALFHCNYVGAAGELSDGPFRATAVEILSASGTSMGFSVSLACPIPSLDALEGIIETGKMYFNVSASLRVGPAPRALPFTGVAGHETVPVIYKPPPSPPPPSPTAPPPRLPNCNNNSPCCMTGAVDGPTTTDSGATVICDATSYGGGWTLIATRQTSTLVSQVSYTSDLSGGLSADDDRLMGSDLFDELFLSSTDPSLSGITTARMDLGGDDVAFMENIDSDSWRQNVRAHLNSQPASSLGECRMFQPSSSSHATTGSIQPYSGGKLGPCHNGDTYCFGWLCDIQFTAGGAASWCWWGYAYHSAVGTGSCTFVSGSFGNSGFAWVR